MIARIFLEGISLPFMGVKKKDLGLWMRKLGKELSYDTLTVAVILTDNSFIQDLNRTYRGKDRPTDVISFDYRDEPFPGAKEDREHLGDIYISLEKTKEQAESYGVDFEDELKRLLVHGVLHLAGYDHEKSRKHAREMRTREVELLSVL